MQWRCPHCDVELGLNDSTMTASWSFTRCYQCNGLAMIRKSEISVVKTDQVPAGENVLLPEPPLAQLSPSAQRVLTRNLPAVSRNLPVVSTPAISYRPYPEREMAYERPSYTQPQAQPQSAVSDSGRSLRLLGLALGSITGTVAIISVSLLLFDKVGSYFEARNQIQPDRHFSKIRPAKFSTQNEYEDRRIVQSEVQNEAQTEKAEPQEVVQEPKPVFRRERTVKAPVQPQRAALITDQVQHRAMAPEKNSLPEIETGRPPTSTMGVRVRSGEANVYSNPGTDYRVVGQAVDTDIYPIVDWSNRWVKIILREQGPLRTLGWIQNDLVRVTPTDDANSWANPAH